MIPRNHSRLFLEIVRIVFARLLSNHYCHKRRRLEKAFVTPDSQSIKGRTNDILGERRTAHRHRRPVECAGRLHPDRTADSLIRHRRPRRLPPLGKSTRPSRSGRTCCVAEDHAPRADEPPNYGANSSSISVTSAAIGDRSLRVSVMCAKSGCPFSFSMTAATPS
ncbi:Uncharacterised protein [Clostridioides difficile]|nr:Uncharacterised protein [Clostridioides difficile]